jgi:crotonobetainyl-CoA:carnitine CoA-transferase CaiB-like acyl-CoA transferase
MAHEVFEGVAVLEVSAGSMSSSIVGMLMADHGARVLKVEPPGGDPLRRLSPSGFRVWNRGKESVEMDLSTPAGQQQVRILAQRADVVVEALRPHLAVRLGLNYHELGRANPSLVYASIKGFGETGPWADLPAYEGVVAAKTGVFAPGPGSPRPGPRFVPEPRASYGAALMAFHGVVAALIVRETTGRGQRVDASMVQGLFPYDYWDTVCRQLERKDPERYAQPAPGRVSVGQAMLCTKDGRWLLVSMLSGKEVRALLAMLQLDDLLTEPRFAGAPFVASAQDALDFQRAILARFRERTQAEWTDRFESAPDVPAEWARTGEEAMEHPQVVHNGHVVNVDDPEVGPVRQVGPIAEFGATPAVIHRGAPRPGQNGLEEEPFAGICPMPTGTPAPASPLEGFSIVELGYFFALPGAIAMVAGLGARVIKLEPPTGDPGRFLAPITEAMAVKTLAGKESIIVDLAVPDGREAVRQIVSGADAFVMGFRPGVAERLGVDEATLRAANPELIYFWAAPYGDGGPYARRPMYAGTATAAVGSNHRFGGRWFDAAADPTLDTDDLRKLWPWVQGGSGGDANAALGSAAVLLMALLAKRRFGTGQRVVSTMLVRNAYTYADDFTSYAGKPPVLLPDRELHGFGALYRLYPAAAGWVFLAAIGGGDWDRLGTVAGLEGLGADSRFATPIDRDAADATLTAELERCFSTASATDWERRARQAGVACVEVDQRGLGEVLSTEDWLVQSGYMADVDHPIFGPLRQHGHHVILSETPGVIGMSGPAGSATRAVLAESGYATAWIDQLISQAALRDHL